MHSTVTHIARCALLTTIVTGCTEPKFGAVAHGEMAANAKLGTGQQDVGVQMPAEANPEGPRSLAVSADERQVFVLDTVNRRVQVYEGARVVRQLALPAAAVSDLALLPNGRLVLFDNSGEGRLFVVDDTGKPSAQIAVRGVGTPEPALVDELLARADGLWLSYRGQYTRLLDAQGRADQTRPTLAGQPTRDGKFLLTALTQGVSLTILKRDRNGVPKNQSATLAFEQPVIHVLALDSDDLGRIYVITLHIWGKGREQRSQALLTILSPELQRLRQLRLPSPESAVEVARYGYVAGSGAVYYLDLAAEAMHVRKFR